MNIKTLLLSIVFVLPAVNFLHAASDALILESPGGEHRLEIKIGPTGKTTCRVLRLGDEILTCENLGFLLENDEPVPGEGTDDIVLPDPKPKQVRNSWKPLYGERNEIPDNYNESVVEYRGLMRIVFRAYDEGVAFCYEFETKTGESLKIKEELTSFVFPDDHSCWSVSTAQGVYENVPLSQVKKDCERPLLVQYPNGKAVSVTEARLVDFARMRLQGSKDSTPNRPVLQAQLAGPVEIKGDGRAYRSPWRVVMAANSPGQLLTRNYLLLNLNDPCKIKDTSWIKPGKVIRDGSLTTVGGKACVDFCVDRNMQYVEFDAGWYGAEFDDKSDATTVTLDPKRNQDPNSFDLQELIRYANSKGIGVIVYVNQKALARQLDEILPLYEKWGVRGIKFGFVHVGSQEWTTWLHDAIAKCAEHKIMVDVHDEYRTTGWERTYPNLMTVEGIRGNEEMPTAEHNVITALTRMLCGRGDYTPCWYNDRVKGSKAHQLALPIVMYSPWTFLYWYDRPAMYKNEQELDLWKEIPTVWDETKVLIDELPNTVAVARRSGDVWYIGILNGEERRTLSIPLGKLLDPTKSYRVISYGDKFQNPADGKDITIKEHEPVQGNVDWVITSQAGANGGGVFVVRPK